MVPHRLDEFDKCSKDIHVDERAGRAKATTLSRMSDVVPGTNVLTVGIVNFRFIGDQWLITGIYGIHGADLLCFNGI